MGVSAIFDSYWYWFSAALLLLLLEILVPGAFLIWIGLGAAGVGVFLFVFPTASLAWQLMALAMSVTAAVLVGVAWQKKASRQQPQGINQGLDSYIGRHAVASQDFVQGQGRVRLDDSFFSAYSHQEISTNQHVLITATDDNGFKVQLTTEQG